MIEHDVHVLRGECSLTLAEAISVDGISSLKGEGSPKSCFCFTGQKYFKMDILPDLFLTRTQKFIQILETI